LRCAEIIQGMFQAAREPVKLWAFFLLKSFGNALRLWKKADRSIPMSLRH